MIKKTPESVFKVQDETNENKTHAFAIFLFSKFKQIIIRSQININMF